MSWMVDPSSLASLVSPWLLLVATFLAAATELVFPPFWGDLTVLAVFFLAARGDVSLPGAFICALLGSTVGALAAYLLGRRYGGRVLRWFGGSVAQRRPLALLRRFGPLLIAVHRFLPVLRGALLYAAGALRLDPLRTLLASFLSSAAWLSVLLMAGSASASTWEAAKLGLASRVRTGSLLVVVAVLLAVTILGHRLARRRAPRRGDAA